jgi:hypothetical protein
MADYESDAEMRDALGMTTDSVLAQILQLSNQIAKDPNAPSIVRSAAKAEYIDICVEHSLIRTSEDLKVAMHFGRTDLLPSELQAVRNACGVQATR